MIPFKNSKSYLIYVFILFIIPGISFLSCQKDTNMINVTWYNLDCDNLRIGIINMDNDIVKLEMNKLMIDLRPKVTGNDRFGHAENLDLLINRLNIQCDNISSELICYACIETLPPQSEISVTTDSAGTMVTRVIDISTPDDDILSCVRIH
jgi:hypothetical protein